MGQVSNGSDDAGYWQLILEIIKPMMLILICVFSITSFVASIEMSKLSAANLSEFTELTASSVMMIPMLITFLGLYGTYHMHKSIMIIFFGLVMLHGLFCGAFLIFSVTNDCFDNTLITTIKNANMTLLNYRLEIFDEKNFIRGENEWTNWSTYEDSWAIDRLQSGLSCCGIRSKHDWNKVMAFNYKMDTIYPKSCCKKPYTDEDKQMTFCKTDDNIYQTGCLEAAKASYENTLIYIGVLCILQVLLMFGAHIISFKVRDPSERPKNPAEIAWSQFVNAQYKPDIKTRSKSCV